MTLIVIVFYLAIGASSATLITALVRARHTGGAGPGAYVHDPLEAAFLAGGPGRVADTVLATMHQDGRIMVAAPGVVGVRHPLSRHPVESAVLDVHAAAPSGALHWLRIGVMRSPAVQAVGDALAARGLLVRPDALRPLRRWAATQTALSFLAFPGAMILTVLVVLTSDEPAQAPLVIQVFPGIVAGLIVGAICTRLAKSRQTAAGRAALRHFTAMGDRTNAAYLVATAGPTAAPDQELGTQLTAASRMRLSARSSASNAAPGVVLVGSTDVSWCGGGSGGASCGGSSCGGSSCGGSSSSCGGGGGGGGSSCGGGGGGGGCGGGGS